MTVHSIFRAGGQNRTPSGPTLPRKAGVLPWTTVTQESGSKSLEILLAPLA